MIHLQRPTKKSDNARSHLSTPRGRVKLLLKDGISYVSTDKPAVAAVLTKLHGFTSVMTTAPKPKSEGSRGPSKASLKAQAKALKIPGYSKMSKPQLASAIEDAS